MKFLFIFLIAVQGYVHCSAQASKSAHNATAVLLNKTAQEIFIRANGSPDTLNRIGMLLDSAIKLDNNYYDAWYNKLCFQCHKERYEDGLKTVRKMKKLFPAKTDPYLYCGVLEYVTGHKKEATASFNTLLKMFSESKRKDSKPVIMWKAISLILVDRPGEGKTILQSLYNAEADGYTKSYIAYYINSSKDEIIKDKIPGR